LGAGLGHIGRPLGGRLLGGLAKADFIGGKFQARELAHSKTRALKK